MFGYSCLLEGTKKSVFFFVVSPPSATLLPDNPWLGFYGMPGVPGLEELIETKVNYVVQESCVVVKDIFRK